MKTFLISLAFIAVASAAVNPYEFKHEYPHKYEHEYPHGVVRQVQDINVDGTYQYAYETASGIAAQEHGVGGEVAEGSARWVAPDGTPVEFSYRADANGYVATGSHVPETPEYVYRAIEWIRSHPGYEDKYYKAPVYDDKYYKAPVYDGQYYKAPVLDGKYYKDYKPPTYKYTEPHVVPVAPVVPVVTPKPFVPTFSTVSPVVSPFSKVYQPVEFKYKSPIFPTVAPAVTVFQPVTEPSPKFSKIATLVG